MASSQLFDLNQLAGMPTGLPTEEWQNSAHGIDLHKHAPGASAFEPPAMHPDMNSKLLSDVQAVFHSASGVSGLDVTGGAHAVPQPAIRVNVPLTESAETPTPPGAHTADNVHLPSRRESFAVQSQTPLLSDSDSPQVMSPTGNMHLAFSPTMADPCASMDSDRLVNDIQTKIDDLAAKAADARVLFHGGQYEKCSRNLSEVQRQLKTIGEIGAKGLSMVAEQQQKKKNGGACPSHDQEKMLYTTAYFSTLQETGETRKRPMPSDLSSEFSVKTLRGTDRQGVHTPQSVPLEHCASHEATSMFGPQSVHSPIYEQIRLLQQSQASSLPAQTPLSFGEAGLLSSNGEKSSTPLLKNPASPLSASPVPRECVPALQQAESAPLAMSANEALQLALDANGLGTPKAWNEQQLDGIQDQSLFSVDAGQDDALMHNVVSANEQANMDEPADGYPFMDRSSSAAEIPPALRTELEEAFLVFLNALCSNLDAKDDRGELIHQTLMPKKMARLDECPGFRPFKFRIQAFTNAFQSELHRRGLCDEECSIKRIKHFLWTHPYISRYNEDGRKAKSKGNHIWNVDAKKVPEGGWVFRTFLPKISGASSKVAHVNERWTWSLRIWDPQMSSSSIKVAYSVNKLPSWLSWADGENLLTGIPTSTEQGGEVSVTALYVHLGQLHRLEHSFFLQVLPNHDGTMLVPSKDLEMEGAQPSMLLMPPAPGTTGHTMQNTAPVGAPQTPLERESIKYDVVEPSQAPGMLSSFAYPFTPPVYMEKHASMEKTILSANTDSIAPPSQQFGMQPNILAPSQPMAQQAVFHGGAPMEKAPTEGENLGSPYPSLHQELMGEDALNMQQMWNTIERRQQEHVASFMLSLPARRPSFSVSEHQGQSTPMSNMPSDFESSLPELHNNTA
ncbi:hypothetical protein MVES1_002231 [Malassezia vespertilionis]|uniref:Uncharacterized protein n=1 Tax=Malassezia vespertilionis TaxID=2020962 RepID=A0A2N1JC38_9BASI|nr:uncharacterized protein MVES1_002231 [Malassezia vespertilionis]PKI84092.1 hypothetical protein MVES_002105 [Malassezia vespertilionis]WFD06876.1 hypothetical protein MVES1_002231 [Malassezia vespertilionis]